MKTNVKVGRHVVRIVTTHTDYGSGTYRPGVRLFLSGPNGSPAGSGPKAWPGHMPVRRFRARHRSLCFGWHRRFYPSGWGWTDALYVPLPHITWATGYRLRHLGGLAAYKLVYRAWKAAL